MAALVCLKEEEEEHTDIGLQIWRCSWSNGELYSLSRVLSVRLSYVQIVFGQQSSLLGASACGPTLISEKSSARPLPVVLSPYTICLNSSTLSFLISLQILSCNPTRSSSIDPELLRELINEVAWTATTTAADILIAGSILYGLLKSKSGWAHTDKVSAFLI
jgi:hypothetical protein